MTELATAIKATLKNAMQAEQLQQLCSTEAAVNQNYHKASNTSCTSICDAVVYNYPDLKSGAHCLLVSTSYVRLEKRKHIIR